VLAAATAFGKTVIAAKLIAERKTSTLVLVHRRQLLSQWIKKLSEFVNIKEELPALENKRGRQKRQFLLGQIGGGKEYVSGIIDVAIMQSLYRENEVKEFVKNYGMVIVDECHHIPAFSFEQILKNVHAKYVYGLTATPVRLDGHHPIIFMHCGPVRFKVDAKQQAEQRPFGHYVIPRFTGFIIPFDKDDANPASGEKQLTIQELYSELTLNEMRNQLIANDVIKNWEDGRSSLVLTERTAHVELLMQKLREKIPDVIKLIGKTGVKENREALNKISETAPGKPLTLVATGKYIGEGFDEPRLDTLFLAMPVSWKGTLQQYVGRLHRLYENKNEVQVYDYVDTHVRMLEKMYNKRLSGYASLGYKTKGELVAVESANFIFNNNSFLPVYNNDIVNAQREIFIISPFVTRRRIEHMLQYLKSAMDNDVKVIIMTRPYEDFNERGGLFLRNNLDILKNEGVNLLFKSNIHQKFAVIDRQIVWYGSINLLSFGSAEESIMRLKSSNIAYELLKIIEE
jgi:superfamily II DNA or RNA helicase